MWIKQIHFFGLNYILQYFPTLWRQEPKLPFDLQTSGESSLQFHSMVPELEVRSNSYFENVLALFLTNYLLMNC